MSRISSLMQPWLSSSSSIPLLLSVSSHLTYKISSQFRTWGETLYWQRGCLGCEMTSVYGSLRTCLLATHRQYIWQKGRLSNANGQGYSVSCSDEEGHGKASQKDCVLGSVRVIHTL